MQNLAVSGLTLQPRVFYEGLNPPGHLTFMADYKVCMQ